MIKKWIVFVVFLMTDLFLNAQGRSSRYNDRSYDVIGLQKGDVVLESILMAIPVIALGLIMMYIDNRLQKKEKDSYFGCLGLITICIGIFILLPLLAWIEFIFVNVYMLLIVILVIVLIIGYFFKH